MSIDLSIKQENYMRRITNKHNRRKHMSSPVVPLATPKDIADYNVFVGEKRKYRLKSVTRKRVF